MGGFAVRTQRVEEKASLPLLLKYADAARELSVSERYIFDLIDLGLLKRVKLGAKPRESRAIV